MNLRQAAQQALEALENAYMVNSWAWVDQKQHVITALRAALAEPEQFPPGFEFQPAFVLRKPLTDEEIEVAAKSVPAAVHELMYGHEITVKKFRAALAEFARAIERAHGIGEQT